MKKIYKDTWVNIIGNCDTLLFFGSQDNETCKYITDIINLGEKDNLISINDIETMNNNQCIINIKGFEPFKDYKFNLEDHINYKYTYNADDNNFFDINNFRP